MSTHEFPTIEESEVGPTAKYGRREHLALVQLWRADTHEREGEVLLLPRRGRPETATIGRGESASPWVRQRPGQHEERGPLRHPKISRRQLELKRIDQSAVEVRLVGRGTLLGPNGEATQSCSVQVGETFGLRGRAIFYLTLRPAKLPALEGFDEALWPHFGGPDALGIVGESEAVWQLRDAIARLGAQDAHTLVSGPSGVGKELAARGVHRLSERAQGPWRGFNAAALPEGLVSAELFGNQRAYPNPGTPARQGLIGAADGGSLLLDEVGELTHRAQAALLRVMDKGGEYTRLGESEVRRSHFRLIGATNRALSSLKPDFLARFPLRLAVPPLEARREDTILIARHLMTALGRSEPLEEVEARALMDPGALVGQVRGLRRVLALDHGPAKGAGAQPRTSADEVKVAMSAALLREALAANRGNRAATARALGLSNRFALYRLLKRYGVEP